MQTTGTGLLQGLGDASPLSRFELTPEYLLAMKIMAMRIDPGSGKADMSDILNLLDVLGVNDKRDLLRFAQGFYPEARVSPQVLLGIDVVWRERELRHMKSALDPDGPHDPPRYLGRAGPTTK